MDKRINISEVINQMNPRLEVELDNITGDGAFVSFYLRAENGERLFEFGTRFLHTGDLVAVEGITITMKDVWLEAV